jgi:hypothetical protein
MFAPGDAEMDLVGDLLGGKTSRLYRALVYERRIATESPRRRPRELSAFQVVVTAALKIARRIDHAITDDRSPAGGGTD